jgi:hypothetical protein
MVYQWNCSSIDTYRIKIKLSLGFKIFTVPNSRIEIFAQSKAVKNYYRGNAFKHKKEDYPKLKTGTLL